MTCTHLLVADSSSARLFAWTEDRKALVEIGTYAHPESRMAGHRLDRDRLPRTHDRMGHHRHAIEPRITPRVRETERFAHELADMLEQHCRTGEFDEWALAAPSRFLTVLHGHLSGQLERKLVLEVPKNLTHASKEELAPLLSHPGTARTGH